MSFQLTDTTSNQQRLTIDNASNANFGQGTPTSQLSINSVPLISNGAFGQSVATPQSAVRIAGSVLVTPATSSTVSCPDCAGFGVVDGPGSIVTFGSPKTSFQVFTSHVTGPVVTLLYTVV